MHAFISTTGVNEKFDQVYFELHSQVQSLLSKTANGLLYPEQCNIVGEIYEEDFAKGQIFGHYLV